MMLGTSGIDSIKHGTKVLNSTLYRHLFAHINKKKVTVTLIGITQVFLLHTSNNPSHQVISIYCKKIKINKI